MINAIIRSGSHRYHRLLLAVAYAFMIVVLSACQSLQIPAPGQTSYPLIQPVGTVTPTVTQSPIATATTPHPGGTVSPTPTISPTETAFIPPPPTITPTPTITRPAITPSTPVAEMNLSDLKAHLDQYRDQFIAVHGFYYTGLVWPACSYDHVPLTEWVFMPDPFDRNQDHMIEVLNNNYNGQFYGSDFFNFLQRPNSWQSLIVFGWVRFYRGPIGCADSTPNPDHEVWYIEAQKVDVK